MLNILPVGRRQRHDDDLIRGQREHPISVLRYSYESRTHPSAPGWGRSFEFGIGLRRIRSLVGRAWIRGLLLPFCGRLKAFGSASVCFILRDVVSTVSATLPLSSDCVTGFGCLRGSRRVGCDLNWAFLGRSWLSAPYFRLLHRFRASHLAHDGFPSFGFLAHSFIAGLRRGGLYLADGSELGGWDRRTIFIACGRDRNGCSRKIAGIACHHWRRLLILRNGQRIGRGRRQRRYRDLAGRGRSTESVTTGFSGAFFAGRDGVLFESATTVVG